MSDSHTYPVTSGLLPCPFCGGEAERFDDHDTGSTNEGGSCICCKRCNASTAMHFDRKENLVSSWNDRRRDAQAADIFKELGEPDHKLARWSHGAPAFEMWSRESIEAALLRVATQPLGVAQKAQEWRDAAEYVQGLISDLHGEHEVMSGPFDPTQWKIDVPVTDLQILIDAQAAVPAQSAVGCGVTEAMCEAAIEAEDAVVDRIQGFSYNTRHVIRDVRMPWSEQEIWSAPVAGPDEYQAFQKRCQIERMRRVLAAALAVTSTQEKSS